FFPLHSSPLLRDLHSLPTRRSSDLTIRSLCKNGKFLLQFEHLSCSTTSCTSHFFISEIYQISGSYIILELDFVIFKHIGHHFLYLLKRFFEKLICQFNIFKLRRSSLLVSNSNALQYSKVTGLFSLIKCEVSLIIPCLS